MTKFVWKEETAAKLVAEYTAQVEENGAAIASSNDNLTKLAEKFGAPSAASIRGKLSAEKAYVKPEKVASKPTTNKVRKAHIVRAIANQLGFEIDSLESLQGGKADALQAVAVSLGLDTDAKILKASEKEYVADNAVTVACLARNLQVEADEIADELAE